MLKYTDKFSEELTTKISNLAVELKLVESPEDTESLDSGTRWFLACLAESGTPPHLATALENAGVITVALSDEQEKEIEQHESALLLLKDLPDSHPVVVSAKKEIERIKGQAASTHATFDDKVKTYIGKGGVPRTVTPKRKATEEMLKQTPFIVYATVDGTKQHKYMRYIGGTEWEIADCVFTGNYAGGNSDSLAGMPVVSDVTTLNMEGEKKTVKIDSPISATKVFNHAYELLVGKIPESEWKKLDKETQQKTPYFSIAPRNNAAYVPYEALPKTSNIKKVVVKE